MQGLSALQLLPCHVLFLTFLLASSPGAETATGPAVAVRADLTHVDSGRRFTKRELLRRMAARSKSRAASLCSSARPHGQAVTAPAVRSTNPEEDHQSEYLLHIGVGTPRPQHVALTMDTGSDVVWTQCACRVCFDQPLPFLDPSASETLRGVSCSDPLVRGELPLSGCAADDHLCFYVYSYGDQSVTAGKIVEDTFTFKAPHGMAAAAVPKLRFGCGMYNTGIFGANESGIAGFGRGPMSLPTQLKVSRFSHCFTSILESRTSPVFLGTPDNLAAHATGPIKSTPFVAGGVGGSSFYYLSLKGVTVGKMRLPFNASVFAPKGDGSGGTIIDSGSAITSFPQAVFRSLWGAFVSQVPLSITNASADSRLCFSVPPKEKAPAVPKLIFHLEGADWDLPRESYLLDLDAHGGTGRELCVVISSAGESNMTIIGNFQQQNMHIVYDLENNKLVFVPAQSSPATAASRWVVTTATGGWQLVLVQGCLAGGWRIRRVLLDLVERGRLIWDQRVLRGSPGRRATGSRPPALCGGALLRFTKPWCDEAPLVLGFAVSRLRLRRHFDGDGGCRRACRRIGAENPRDRSVFFCFFGCFCAVVLGQLSLLSLSGRFPRMCVLLYLFPFG